MTKTKTYETIGGETRESLFLEFLDTHRKSIEDEIFRFLPRSDNIGPKMYGLEEHWKMVVDYP